MPEVLCPFTQKACSCAASSILSAVYKEIDFDKTTYRQIAMEIKYAAAGIASQSPLSHDANEIIENCTNPRLTNVHTEPPEKQNLI